MKRDQNKSRFCIISVFIILMLYCVICLYYEFNYLDLGYLVVVVVSFIRYLYLRKAK